MKKERKKERRKKIIELEKMLAVAEASRQECDLQEKEGEKIIDMCI